MGVAAGMALSGLRPVIYALPRLRRRGVTSRRVDAYLLKASGDHRRYGSEAFMPTLGGPHSCEDLQLQVLLNIFAAPGINGASLPRRRSSSLPRCAAHRQKGEPVYFEDLVLEIGRSITVRNGSDVCLISTGTMPVVIDAAKC